MMSCQQAARLMSQQQDRPLSWQQRAGLQFHLAICQGCRNYRRQMDFLRQACRRFGSEK